MALFKIAKGLAEDLVTQKAKEGNAWFTKDDGKLYIDIAGTGIEDAIVKDVDNADTANRIPINSDFADRLKLKDNQLSIDEAIVRFDGTDGHLQNSSATINDDGDMTINGKLNLNGNGYFNGAVVLKEDFTYGELLPMAGVEGRLFFEQQTYKLDVELESTDNAIARFNGTTGDLQNSTATIDDTGHMTVNGASQFEGYSNFNSAIVLKEGYGFGDELPPEGQEGQVFFVPDLNSNCVSSDNAIARFDGTAGQLQNSSASINDAGDMTLNGALFVRDRITLGSIASYIDKDTYTGTANQVSHSLKLYVGNTTPYTYNGSADKTVTVDRIVTQAQYNALSGTSTDNVTYYIIDGVEGVTGGVLTAESGTVSGNLTVNTLTVTSTRASTSSGVGAVTVAGGLYCGGNIYAGKVYGSVWNDYAEYRSVIEFCAPGYVVQEDGQGHLHKVNQRLAKGCEIISDTFGFSIGKNKYANTPIAIAGRVLAYTDKDPSTFVIGMPVCSGENGTVSLMTEEEARLYPWCIIGTVSEIPTYDTWNEIVVNNRIWIRVH